MSKINWPILHFEWILYPYILPHHALIIWKLLIHRVMQIFQMLTHFIKQCFKTMFPQITTNNIREIFSNGKLWQTSFSNFSFSLENITSIVNDNFPSGSRIIWFDFEKTFTKCPSLNYHTVSQLFFQEKNDDPLNVGRGAIIPLTTQARYNCLSICMQ